MGLLDPKLNKERTFELLRKKGAVKAVLEFSGGHDEGNVDSITLVLADGSTQKLEVWYCGGYTINAEAGYGSPNYYVPLSTPANEDEELSDLLQGPVNEQFGSWGSVPYTSGEVVWYVEAEGDAEAETAKMNFTQDEPEYYELEV